MFFVCHCQDQYPIQPLLEQLKQQGIVYELRHEQDGQALWIEQAQWVEAVRKAYESYQQAMDHQKQHTLSVSNLKQLPITVAFIVVSLVVAFITQLGANGAEHFFIAQLQYYPRTWIAYSGVELVWHSISPIFLHFSIEHLAFNCLSLWYLGSVLERHLPKVGYLLMIVVLALVSNYSQLLVSGPLFGGLSGMVYGLIGFAFCYQKWIKPLGIANGFLYIAIAWMALGYTPFFAMVGLGNMANTAHLSGLLAGVIVFIISYVFLKKSAYEH